MSQRLVFKDQRFQKYQGDATRIGTVELFIDWSKIVRELGLKAAFNKSGKSGLKLGIKAKFTLKETT